jgi:hypothetical protein
VAVGWRSGPEQTMVSQSIKGERQVYSDKYEKAGEVVGMSMQPLRFFVSDFHLLLFFQLSTTLCAQVS